MRNVFLALILTLFIPASLSAEPEQVIIQDTSGVMRATGEGGNIPVEFQAVDDQSGQPANGREVTLRNVNNPKQTLSKVFVNGTAVFENVPAGTWEVAANGVTFQDVAIGSAHAFAGTAIASGASAGLSSSTVAAGGLVAAGGTAAVVAGNSRGSSDNKGGGSGSIFPENPEELSPSS